MCYSAASAFYSKNILIFAIRVSEDTPSRHKKLNKFILFCSRLFVSLWAENLSENYKHMANKEPGYVYILTNPSFREDWVKISRPFNCEKRHKSV